VAGESACRADCDPGSDVAGRCGAGASSTYVSDGSDEVKASEPTFADVAENAIDTFFMALCGSTGFFAEWWGKVQSDPDLIKQMAAAAEMTKQSVTDDMSGFHIAKDS